MFRRRKENGKWQLQFCTFTWELIMVIGHATFFGSIFFITSTSTSPYLLITYHSPHPTIIISSDDWNWKWHHVGRYYVLLWVSENVSFEQLTFFLQYRRIMQFLFLFVFEIHILLYMYYSVYSHPTPDTHPLTACCLLAITLRSRELKMKVWFWSLCHIVWDEAHHYMYKL